MRPKLNADTYYMEVADGAFFRNSRGIMQVKGKNAYRWMEALAPHLDGQHDLEELLSDLDADRARTARDLLQALQENSFLRDIDQDLPHGLPDDLLTEYAPEIAFIESFRDSGAYHFARFRACHVVLIGSGLVMAALARSALASGLQHVSVLLTTECAMRSHIELDDTEQFRRDAAQTLTKLTPLEWADEVAVADVLAPCDAVLHVSDRPMLRRAQLLNRICSNQRKPLLQAMTVEDHTWIGPLSGGAAGAGCWECGWRRLQANVKTVDERLPQYAFDDHTNAPISRSLAIPTAGIVAGHLVFEVFKHLVGIAPSDLAGSFVAIDLETLETQRHPFHQHPVCSHCSPAGPATPAGFLDTIEHLERAEPCDVDAFSQEAMGLIDPCTGILAALDEGDINQMPLFVSTAIASNPSLGKTSDDPLAVFGVGSALHIARRRAAQRGLEVYAATLVDHRRLLDAPLPDDGFIVERADQVCNASPSPPEMTNDSWTWAYELHSQEVHLVPALLAFPTVRGSIEPDDIEIGVGSGMTWAEAVARGLLSWCRHLTLREVPHARAPFPQVDLSAVSLEPEGTRQRRVLDLVSEMVTVYDVTGSLCVPTFAICLDDAVAACSAGTHVGRALREGFESSLLHYQLRHERVVGYRPLQLPDTFFSLRGTAQTVPQSVTADDWPASQRWLQQQLRDNGWRALAVPLDHDPTVCKVLPFLVRVVLARASS